MPEITVQLRIPAHEYVKMYRGSVREVLARSVDGRSIRFPANILRPFVTRGGVQGSFRIRYDETGKLQHIERIRTA